MDANKPDVDGKLEFDRLFLVQGVTSLLNALCVIEHFNRLQPEVASRDCLVLSWGGTEESNEIKMRTLCLSLSGVGNFAKVYSIANLEQLTLKGCLSFEEAVTRFQRALGARAIHRIFLGRNFQLVNELVGNAFPDTPLTCFGDFFGIHDSDPVGGSHFSQRGFRRLDSLTAIFPIELTEQLFSKYPLQMIPIDVFFTVIFKASELVKEGLLQVLPKGKYQNSAVVLLSYESEGHYTKSLTHEVDAYFDQIVQFVPNDKTLLIKAHPRERLGQETALIRRLQTVGYRCISLRQVRHIPIEIIIANLDADLLVSSFSNSGVSVAAFSPITILAGLGSISLKNNLNENFVEQFNSAEAVSRRFIESVQAGHVEPALWNYRFKFQNDEFPKFFRPKKSRSFFPDWSGIGGGAVRQMREAKLTEIVTDFEFVVRHFIKRLGNWVLRQIS